MFSSSGDQLADGCTPSRQIRNPSKSRCELPYTLYPFAADSSPTHSEADHDASSAQSHSQLQLPLTQAPPAPNTTLRGVGRAFPATLTTAETPSKNTPPLPPTFRVKKTNGSKHHLCKHNESLKQSKEPKKIERGWVLSEGSGSSSRHNCRQVTTLQRRMGFCVEIPQPAVPTTRPYGGFN